MNTWHRRALGTAAVAALMLTVTGCGHPTPPVGPVGQQVATSGPKQAGITGADARDSGEIWFINPDCPWDAPMSAQAGVDMAGGSMGDFDSSVTHASCIYSTTLSNSSGTSLLQLDAVLTSIPQGQPPVDERWPGATSEDLSRTLGKGAYKTTYTTSGGTLNCTLVVPARDLSGRDEGMALRAIERDPSRVDICPTLTSFLGLFAYQAAANSKAPSGSGQAAPTSTPSTWSANKVDCTDNYASLSFTKQQACLSAGFIHGAPDPGFTPDTAHCMRTTGPTLTTPEQEECAAAGFGGE